MVFVTAGGCKTQLENLTQVLVSAFQGSTIYRHTDPFRLLHDVLHQKIDAVFLVTEKDKANSLEFVQMLRRQKPDIPVFAISDTEDLRKQATDAGVNDYLILPVGEQKLWDVMQSVKNQVTMRPV